MSDIESTDAAETGVSESPAEQPAPKPSETVDFWKQKAREQEKRAKENADAAKRLAELEAQNLSEVEKAQKTAQEATERLAEYERTAMRQKVALEKGLPAELVGRLQGVTEDELSEDADALLSLLKKDDDRTPGPYVPAEGHSPSAQALNSDGLEDDLRRKLGI